MKRKRNILMLLMIICLTSIQPVYAYDIIVDNICYNLFKKDKTAFVTSRNYLQDKYKGNIIIPLEIGVEGINYKVIGITDDCFKNCIGITSIVLPETIEYIGRRCFFKCAGLKSITIPSSVKKIGGGCFYGCASLENVSLPENINSLSAYKSGSEVYGFFEGCSSFHKFEFSSSINIIGERCFKDCSKLINVNIPATVLDIEGGCFCGCSMLTTIQISTPLTVLKSSKDWTGTCGFFEGCTSLTRMEVPKSVIEYDDCCFRGCSQLLHYEIPENVTRLGDDCFTNCNSLKSINIPNTLKTIGRYCFSNCSNLQNIKLPEFAEINTTGLFYGCTSITIVR